MVDAWPHQRRVVEETAEAWPEGRLLCDEVGMGKTIEAILVLRRLLAGRGVRRALLLLPKGILKQWQAELREKGGMIFPRLEGVSALVWPDEREERVDGLPEALKQDVLLMSRETARTENNLPHLLAAEPWDLVLLDEAHAARRRKQEEGEFNSPTLLLNLLRELQLRGRARGILLLSATPMQTHPWEPWDLLSVLGEGGAWLADFSGIRDYYRAVDAVRNGRCDIETGRKAAALVTSDPDFPKPPVDSFPLSDPDTVASRLSFCPPTQREPLAQWLRQGSPLARRMHRSTRSTLRRYYELGLLPDPPPRRTVEDVLFDYRDSAEREVYNSIGRYIEKRFQELEREKPGKGFVMTVYRRRASSSPLALERSLERRRAGLIRIADRKAFDPDLPAPDEPEALDADELPDVDGGGRVSAAFPQDPQTARRELAEVERLLEELRALGGRDSKRDRFFDVFRKVTEDGRPVLVFTEYTDTMEYLRDSLGTFYARSLGCYSGDGGQLWDGERWKPVTKGDITDTLRRGELRALICTDAASEGLNLQAAGAVINYDLPWNPSRIEQRIGRIDRIGQKYSEVQVVNLFLKDSVDDRVYRVLRERCGLFEHFVGAMQPVLARARRMLLGQETPNPDDLRATATEVEQDPLAHETYIESCAESKMEGTLPLSRAQVESSLAYLNGMFGFTVRPQGDTGRHLLSGPGISRAILSCGVNDLEHDRNVLPLSPLEPRLRTWVNGLFRPGERLPLVIGSCQKGPFRTSVAYWVGEGALEPMKSMEDLVARAKVWDGKCPDAGQWQQAGRVAYDAATEQVTLMMRRASKREREMRNRQIAAAGLRLKRELGRYLVCLGRGVSDLNAALYQQMSRDIASAQRLKQCLDKLDGYPDWPPELRRELEDFIQGLPENQRRARLLGSEIDAALDDPRWAA
jgi:superfamily II DNA or RNA helicase